MRKITMTKGTKIFRIIISVILMLSVLWTAFTFTAMWVLGTRFIHTQEYGIYVAGVSVTRTNKNDILGDGTVYYDDDYNVLVFDNAVIESENTIIYSYRDLIIGLYGENKFVCPNTEFMTAIYASDYTLAKDLYFEGDGSLLIEFPNATGDAMAIYGSKITFSADVTIEMPDCSNIANGIVCESSLLMLNQSTLTVINGSAKYSTALGVRGNAQIDHGSTINITTRPGTTDSCKGIFTDGDLIVGNGSALNVSIDDETAKFSECINVSGLFDIGEGATVTASSKKTTAIECYGAIELNTDANVSASTADKETDILCYGAVVNYGATVDADINALCGIHNMTENADQQ